MSLMASEDEVIGPFNMGNPGEFTMNELAQKVIKLTGSNSIILQQPLPQDDPKQRKPDISKAVQMLNWEPKIDLDTGLQKTIEYFKTVL